MASAATTARYGGAEAVEPDADRVEARQVLRPQPGRRAPRGHQRAAAERAGAEQPALGDQRDYGERHEELDAGVGDDPADDGLRVDELLVFRLFRSRLVHAARGLRRSAGQQPRDVLREVGESAARRDERARRRVALPAPRGPAPPGSPQPQGVAEKPRHPVELGGGQVELLGDQEVGGPHQRPGHAPGHDAEHGQQRQVHGEHVKRVAPVQLAQAARLTVRGVPAPPGGQFAVVQHGIGDDLHAVAGALSPPAEVHVVAEQLEPGVEPAEPVPGVPPDQHAGGPDREHGAVVIVLALVDLTWLDPGYAAAGPVD